MDREATASDEEPKEDTSFVILGGAEQEDANRQWRAADCILSGNNQTSGGDDSGDCNSEMNHARSSLRQETAQEEDQVEEVEMDTSPEEPTGLTSGAEGSSSLSSFLSSSHQQQGSPPRPSDNGLVTLNHEQLRTAIKGLPTTKACAKFYDANVEFQQCIRLLRQAQNQYIRESSRRRSAGGLSVAELRDSWAQLWAVALSHDEEWAWTLNLCRKTMLELLYQVCNLCFQNTDNADDLEWSDELEGTFKLRRIDELLIHCLAMDRANALRNMTIRPTGEVGLGWYSKYTEERYCEMYNVPPNPRGPTINKRLWWLFHVPALHEDPAIQNWMEVAVPARLQRG